MVNFVVPQDFGGGLDFLAKAKSVRPRPRPRINITDGDTAISNAIINATIDTVIQRTWVTAAGGNFVFKIAAKPLQIETWLLLTAYKNSSSPYPTVSSVTHYNEPLSHNTARLA